MSAVYIWFLVVAVSAAVSAKPVADSVVYKESAVAPSGGHSLWKRFVDPAFTFGTSGEPGLGKMRTRRSAAEECEKLSLCKLHARSRSNFISAFELYFVNKENARLWDHRERSLAACHQQFHCYDYDSR